MSAGHSSKGVPEGGLLVPDEDVVRGAVATRLECDRDSRIKRNEGERGRFSITLVPLDE